MFSDPTNLTSALRFLAGKDLMPTALSTNELRAVDRDIRAKSLYSARTLSLDYLGGLKDALADMLSGKTNLATARQELQLKLDALSYNPITHFGTPGEKDIPPAEPGSLRDLSSDKRIDLVLNTNLRMAANLGETLDGNDPDSLHDFPCWELVRFYDREVPRGYERTKEGLAPVPGDAWTERWVRCGGRLYDGRMIARKDAPVWSALGDSGIFEDGTDSDVPPYAYNSGFDRRTVARAECVALGVLGEEDTVNPDSMLPNILPKLEPEILPLADLKAARNDLLAAAKAWRAAA